MSALPAELWLHIASFGDEEKDRLRELSTPLMATCKVGHRALGQFVRARAAARLAYVHKEFREMRRRYGQSVLALWTAEHHMTRALRDCECGRAESEYMKYLSQRLDDDDRENELMATGEGSDYPWVDTFVWNDK
jgi:hypothetical protein